MAFELTIRCDNLAYAYGGNGDDWLFGSSGSDRLYGEDGDDDLYGYAGDDELYGGSQDDYIDGGTGSDWMYGYEGNETGECSWGPANSDEDEIRAGGNDSAHDWLWGCFDSDVLVMYDSYDWGAGYDDETSDDCSEDELCDGSDHDVIYCDFDGVGSEAIAECWCDDTDADYHDCNPASDRGTEDCTC